MKHVTVNLPRQKGDNDGHCMPNSTIQADKIVSLAPAKVKQGAEVAEVAKKGPCNNDHHEDTKQKSKDEYMGLQSLEMLKVRANHEERLKEKGLYYLTRSKLHKRSNTRTTDNKKDLQTLDDFDDEVQKNSQMIKPSKLMVAAAKSNTKKLVSGDDDLPKRDNIGERRRKHELRALSRVGANTHEDDHELLEDDDHTKERDQEIDEDDNDDDHGLSGSEDEFYKDVKKRRTEKLSTKKQK